MWWIWTAAGGDLVVATLSVLSRRASRPSAAGEPSSGRSESPAGVRRTQRVSLTWRTAFRIALPLYIVSTLAQFVVWLLLGIQGTYDAPWWAWSALPLGGVVLVIAALAKNEKR